MIRPPTALTKPRAKPAKAAAAAVVAVDVAVVAKVKAAKFRATTLKARAASVHKRLKPVMLVTQAKTTLVAVVAVASVESATAEASAPSDVRKPLMVPASRTRLPQALA